MPFPFFIFVALFITGVIIYTAYFSPKAIVKRKIKNTEGKDISEVQEGERTRIKGRIVYGGKTLAAPISGRKCSYYHILVEEKGQKNSWHNVITEEAGGDVILKNGKHYALIDTRVVNTYIDHDQKYESSIWEKATPKLERYLRQHNEKSKGFLNFSRSLRYKEGVLEENEIVAVVGYATWINTSLLQLSLPVTRVLYISAHKGEPVYFSDHPDITY